MWIQLLMSSSNIVFIHGGSARLSMRSMLGVIRLANRHILVEFLYSSNRFRLSWSLFLLALRCHGVLYGRLIGVKGCRRCGGSKRGLDGSLMTTGCDGWHLDRRVAAVALR